MIDTCSCYGNKRTTSEFLFGNFIIKRIIILVLLICHNAINCTNSRIKITETKHDGSCSFCNFSCVAFFLRLFLIFLFRKRHSCVVSTRVYHCCIKLHRCMQLSKIAYMTFKNGGRSRPPFSGD